ncbi:MAG: cell division protein FtsZ [Bacteroidales bacterium]|nr:cell division protein FtsZ [Bacteroidales bacterium]
MDDMIRFSPKHKTSIIKVIGVGGGGSNAVNYMFKQGIEGVDFVVCNTDMQALSASPVPVKVQLGESGLGAGSNPEVAEKAANESMDKLEAVIDSDTEMVFITAGMGGGTGTGAAPVIARFARERGLLSVGIVTLPFHFEGRRKMLKARQGIEEMRKYVDTLLVIDNDILRELFPNLGLGNAFSEADNVLSTAAKGIAELITVHGYVNVDFEDVKTVMKDSGKAIMGSAITEGEDRALKAIEEAMHSPLLSDNDVHGAKNILLYITTGVNDVTMDEISVITDYIADRCGEETANVIWGRGIDESMGDKLGITIIATGFDEKDNLPQPPKQPEVKKEVKRNALYDDMPEAGKTDKPSVHHLAFDDKLSYEKPKDEYTKGIEAKPEIDELDFKVSEPDSKPKKIYTLGDSVDEDQPKSKTSNPFQDNDFVLPFDKSDSVSMHIKPADPKPVQKMEIKQETLVQKPDFEVESHAQERINKLKALSMMKDRSFSDMEKQPAYMRKNVQLSEPSYSDDSQVSKYTISEDSKNNSFLKSDNSFLHDNVD